MYFDAVLDDNFQPVFNGTPEETKAWLGARPEEHSDWQVCPGRSMNPVSVDKYLAC